MIRNDPGQIKWLAFGPAIRRRSLVARCCGRAVPAGRDERDESDTRPTTERDPGQGAVSRLSAAAAAAAAS